MEGDNNGQFNLRSGDSPGTQGSNNQHFQVFDADGAKVKILNFRDEKLLRKKTIGNQDFVTVDGDKVTCGNECYFIIEPIILGIFWWQNYPKSGWNIKLNTCYISYIITV